MKVLWVSSFPVGGIGDRVFLRKQVDALADQGCDIDIMNTGPLFSPMSLYSARKELRSLSGNYDLCHAQWGSGCGYLVSTLPSKKVLTLRGSDWYGSGGEGRLLVRSREWLGAKITRVAIPKFDQVILVSSRMFDQVGKVFNQQSLNVIPTGIDLHEFRPLSKEKARLKLGLPKNGGPYFLFVSSARDYGVKRRALALATVEKVKYFFPSSRLIEAVNKSREEILLYMSAADALILTSIHEGWPNAVKEALACDLPFVSTDVSDLKEISNKTLTCSVVNADPDSLALALKRIVELDRPQKLRKFVECMSIEKTACKIKYVYQKALNQK